MVLHALERDHTIAGSLDHFPKHLETVSLAQAMLDQLVLNQALGRILERLLHLADANRPQALFG